jgi:CHAD domain-containing protein
MVNKKRLRKYLYKHLEGLKNNLNDLSEQMDADKLHDLRLHAKKVKAVSGFLKSSLHDKNKYSIKELKELFHAAGDIRTAQLNLEMLKEHSIETEKFEKEQKQVIDKGSEAIAVNKKKFTKNISSLRKRISDHLTAVKSNSAIAFYYENIKVLSNNFKVIDEADLHDNRKIIKTLLYNLKVLPTQLALEININKDYLDRLQELIGKWHDTVVTMDLLREAGTVNEEDFAALTTRRHEQLEAIVNETRGFDSNVMYAKRI